MSMPRFQNFPKDENFSVIWQTYARNGNTPLVLKRLVYPNKPKCWVEGHEYKFNNTLISIQTEKEYENEARSSTHT